MRTVEEIYRGLPVDVAEDLRMQVEFSGNLVQYIKRLHLPACHGLLNQHQSIYDFVKQFGPEVFFKAVRSNLTREELIRLKMSYSRQVEPETSAEEIPEIQTFRPKPAAVDFPQAAPMQQSMPLGPGVHAPVEKQFGLEFQRPKPLGAGLGHVSHPNYQGPDRRRGINRRNPDGGRRRTITWFQGEDRRREDRRVGERRGNKFGFGLTGNRRRADRRRYQTQIAFSDRRRTSASDRRKSKTG